MKVLLLSYGYKYSALAYERKLGMSQWTLGKKVKLLIDIFISNSYLSLRIVSLIWTISSLDRKFGK